jgi:hypothetical protein
LEEW